MTYDVLGPGALDYLPCRYGKSRLLFRGPKRKLEQPFAAFLGGTETYGKFIEKPFPNLVEEELGMSCVNFGTVNAGIDVYLHDPFVVEAVEKAQVTVVQIMGAQNMSNRLYSVHKRRNDRFLKASALLCTIFREVDFADFSFNRHMLKTLLDVSPSRFEAVRVELQEAWLARMKSLLGQIKGKIILLWFANHAPMLDSYGDAALMGDDPLFITRSMLDEIAPLVTRTVEVVASPRAIEEGTEGMIFDQMESQAAQLMLGRTAHHEAADALSHAVRALL